MRWLAAAVAACLLCGCSMVQLAYDNAGTYLRWRAGNYLDVHGEQAEALDAAIEDFHRWHRRQALPQYAQLALDASQKVEDGVSPADLDEWLAPLRVAFGQPSTGVLLDPDGAPIAWKIEAVKGPPLE